jgi:hypothetical protein
VFSCRSPLSSGQSQARSYAGSIRAGLWRPARLADFACEPFEEVALERAVPNLSAAYAAIAATLPLGMVAVEPERAQDGRDVILRLAKGEGSALALGRQAD